MKERRRFPRHEASLEVRYATPGNVGIEGYTVTKDVSRVGTRLPITRIIRQGDILNLDIDPNDHKGNISALGRVVWTRPIERPAPLELDAGVEFIKINSSDADRLEPSY